jgi:Coenzyme PQQ synthesis protein D (PqqD)
MSEHLRVPDQVQFNRVEGQIVLLDLKRGFFYSLDEVGSTIWEAVAKQGTVEAAVTAVLSSYEVDEKVATEDASRMIELWKTEGLLLSSRTE